MIKLIIIGVVSFAWYLGGGKLAWIRDILVPIIMGLAVALLTPCSWLTKLWLFPAVTACWQIIRLGYGNYSPEDDPKPSFLASITHDRGGWYIRAIYGFLVAILAALVPYLAHFLPLWVYLAYILYNTAIGYSISRLRLPVLLADLAVGAGFASLLFWI